MTDETTTLCKLIILYMLNRVDFSMSYAQISDFILGKEYSDYLSLHQAQSELIDSGLISIDEAKQTPSSTKLCITAEGRETLRYFQSRVGGTIRNEIEDYFTENEYQIKNELAVYGNYYPMIKGGFEVHLVAQEEDEKLMDLTMNVPTEEIAEHICDNWQSKSSEVYQLLVKELF